MKDKRLKPCPMCGNESPDIYDVDAFDDYECWCVKCSECGLELNDYHQEDDAIDAWNKRVESKVENETNKEKNKTAKADKTTKVEVSNMVNVADLVIEPLAPCPFCGKLPLTRINVKNNSYGGTQVVLKVQCRDINCGVFKTVSISNDVSFDKLLDGIKNVAKLWNQRIKID